jgi:hypothetical protein
VASLVKVSLSFSVYDLAQALLKLEQGQKANVTSLMLARNYI